MKFIVFGAAGDVGSRIVSEAVDRGHQVTAVVRRENARSFASAVNVVVRDVSSADDLEDVIVGHQVAITALRPPGGGEDLLVPLTQAVVRAARKAQCRFIVVGGAAVLRVPATPGHTVLTAPGFLPKEVIPIATACAKQFEWCLMQLDSFGTYLSPPAILTAGERSGRYRLGSDTLVTDDRGRSQISMEDFAVAIVDESEHPRHTGYSFTVGY